MSAVIDWNVTPIALRENGFVGTLFLAAMALPPHPVVIIENLV
jgi:hypothetical protein